MATAAQDLHLAVGDQSMIDRALALSGAGAWACEIGSDRLWWSSGVYRLFGIAPGAVLDRRAIVEMYAPESRAAMERVRAAALAGCGPFSIEVEINGADGVRRWMRLTGDVERVSGRPVRLYGMKRDITAERARLTQLRARADRDALTGLANRARFQQAFFERPSPRLGALALFDVDGFKTINDNHGHAAGDACLRTIAERLIQAFPDALLIARIGGDEFAVLVDGAAARLLGHHIPRVLQQLALPVRWREAPLSIGASAGIAWAETGMIHVEAMFDRADAALYEAKRRRRRAGEAQSGG